MTKGLRYTDGLSIYLYFYAVKIVITARVFTERLACTKNRSRGCLAGGGELFGRVSGPLLDAALERWLSLSAIGNGTVAQSTCSETVNFTQAGLRSTVSNRVRC